MAETNEAAQLAAYEAYLERADRELGQVAVGAYGKFNGVLVKKLSPIEFHTLEREYVSLRTEYETELRADATINTMQLKTLRRRAAELILDPFQ